MEAKCHQYEKKNEHLKSDLIQLDVKQIDISNIKISNFEFHYVPKDNSQLCEEIKQFIIKYEWLQKMPSRPTHRFISTYKGEIVACLVMASPYSPSKLLGDETKHIEKVISRGASVSWAPKNIGSWMIMKSIQWMVSNTQFRLFTGYCDTEAKELGTIYQACNFLYLGKIAGTRFEYFDNYNPNRGWFNDRVFRRVGAYKRYASILGIEWQKQWSSKYSMNWEKIPTEIILKLKDFRDSYQKSCIKREVQKKHKYIYIKGSSKIETKHLLGTFYNNNPKYLGKAFNYPKERGK